MPSTPAHRSSSLPQDELELEPQDSRQLQPQDSQKADEEFEMLLAKVGRAVIPAESSSDKRLACVAVQHFTLLRAAILEDPANAARACRVPHFLRTAM